MDEARYGIVGRADGSPGLAPATKLETPGAKLEMLKAKLETLRVDRDGAVATVTLDRPAVLHALNAAMFDELEEVFRLLAVDDAVRVVLLTGSGERAFAAGADIRGLLATDAVSGRAVSERGQAVFAQIAGCGKPVIACINGVALGGGCELALACTFRLMADTAKLGLPELKLGLIPGYGGTQRLARLAGPGQALRLMLSAATLSAEEALRLGVVEEVVPAAALMERARTLAGVIAALAPLAVAGVMESLREDAGLEDGLRREAEIFGRLCGTEDKREGLAAFLEKRQAMWAGR